MYGSTCTQTNRNCKGKAFFNGAEQQTPVDQEKDFVAGWKVSIRPIFFSQQEWESKRTQGFATSFHNNFQ
jgi:hypothetical protein